MLEMPQYEQLWVFEKKQKTVVIYVTFCHPKDQIMDKLKNR